MNCVIIGFGYGAKNIHYPLISHPSNDLKVYGIYARRESVRIEIKNFIKEKNMVIFDSYESVLSDDQVNVVVIATATPTHFDLAMKALNAKKNVIVDKPLCTTVAEVEELKEAARVNGVFLTVFQNRRLDGDFLTAKKLIEEKKLGDKINWMEISWQKYGITTKEWKNSPVEVGGGRFWDLGIHVMDQLLQLVPYTVTSVFCRIQRDFINYPSIDSFSMIILSFENGSTGIVDISCSTFISKPRFNICGNEGTFVKNGVDPQEEALIKGEIEILKDHESNYGT